jgi:hypothetical protein
MHRDTYGLHLDLLQRLVTNMTTICSKIIIMQSLFDDQTERVGSIFIYLFATLLCLVRGENRAPCGSMFPLLL